LGPAGKYVASLAGVTTGRGTGTIQQAYQGGKDFVAGMRGKIPIAGVAEDMKSALRQLRGERGSAYRTELAKIQQLDTPLDLAPVYQEMTDKFKDFNIKLVPGAVGEAPELDFSRSVIHNPADQAKVRGVYNDLMSWELDKANQTPIGIDTLKRRLDDFYADSSMARSLVSGISGKVRSVLDTVPGYKDMVRNYQVSSDMIKAFESELSLGEKANPGAAIRKIINVFNQNNEYKVSLLEALNKYSGKNLEAEVAGVGMSSMVPTGIMRPLLGAGVISVVSGAISPQALLGIASASPRIIGELSVKAGQAARLVKKAEGTLPFNPEFYRPVTLPFLNQKKEEQ
jgi:hypothetical protein